VVQEPVVASPLARMFACVNVDVSPPTWGVVTTTEATGTEGVMQ
jgi:hypothetical protein